MVLAEFARCIAQTILPSDTVHRRGFVIVAGAPAVGKTVICQTLQGLHPSLGHVEMESYFHHSREQRREMGLNGFDLETYDTRLMKEHLSQYVSGNRFVVHKYEHGTGFSPDTIEVSPSQILLVEGFAFSSLLPEFDPYCVAKYFIYPSHTDEWVSLHVERDCYERPSPVSRNILLSELRQKAKSLARSFSILHSRLSDAQFICVSYGEHALSNEYVVTSNVEGKEFIHELELL
jgi:uridine kinase